MNQPIGKRMRLGLCLLVVAMALGMVAISLLSKPKLYKGKTVRQWVSLLDMHAGYKKQRDEASSALVQIGAPALPELERILAWRPNVCETVRIGATRPEVSKK